MNYNIESAFSFNGSLIKENDLKELKNYGYDEIGLVDTSTSFFIAFYQRMKKDNIKPILGYRVRGGVLDVILYPINADGYREMLYFASSINNQFAVSLDSIPMSKNFIYVIDATYYSDSDTVRLDGIYDMFKSGGVEVYIGLDFNYYPCEAFLYPMVKDYDCLFIGKVKYLRKEDKRASEVLYSILKDEKMKEASLFDFDVSMSMHLRNKDEFYEEFKEHLDLIEKTREVFKKVNIEISFDKHFPKYPLKDGIESKDYLKSLSYAGLKKRLSGTRKNQNAYLERLNYELSIIDRMGFNDYFLIVYDFILFAKKKGIYVGPGRGSGASSLVSYSIGIVDTDPLEYNLYFERFLNPARKTMPDIDTDFEDTRRKEVIEYVRDKYGEYRVSLISTFQTFLAKSSITEVAKRIGMPEERLPLITNEIDDDNSVSKLLGNPKVRKYMEMDDAYRTLLEISSRIEGIPQSTGYHPAGVIISDADIREYSEIHHGNSTFYQTSYDHDSLESLGLLKMDFLSLKNLTSLRCIVELIERYEGIRIDLNKIPLNDQKTLRLLSTDSPLGIFQLESRGMNSLAKKMGIRSFSDLAICIALYRPGPMENIPEYLKRRQGNMRIDYYDPCLRDILEETLGIMIYQEQVMMIVSRYSGFTLAEADILRRAISKKDASLIKELEEKFYEGARKLGRREDVTKRIFKDIYRFSDFGFNKAHTISYAKVAYEFAYLKANFPREFMMEYIDSNKGVRSIQEAKRLGLQVEPPDIRISSSSTTLYSGSIYLPFVSVKGISPDMAMTIEEIVGHKNMSFEEFVARIDGKINREAVESLIMAGAFDYTGYNKRTMMEALPGLLDFNTTLISGFKQSIVRKEEYDFDTLKNKEFSLFNFNLKYHPMKKYNGSLPRISNINIGDKGVKIIGYITNVTQIKTKKGDAMASIYIEDEFSHVRGVIFTRDYMNCMHFLRGNQFYEIIGSYEENKGESQFIVRTLKEINV